jgi:CubicO group peptidase (beta-lactamase class C family)
VTPSSENFTRRGEVGGAFCVYWRGEEIINLWGGWRDESQSLPWEHDTLVAMYSSGKGLLSTLLLRYIDRGELTWSTPLADIWPELHPSVAATATIDHLLTHRAGLPAIGPVLRDQDLAEWSTITGALEATEAWFEPGTRLVYHANTFGHLVGEMVRRLSSRRPGLELQRVVEGLDCDVHFGLSDRDQRRCADVLWSPATPTPAIESFAPYSGDALMNVKAHFNPPGYSSIGLVNTALWRSLDIGSTSGHASARGLARFYDALLRPDQLLSATTLAEATEHVVSGDCPILAEHVSFARGFQPTMARRPLGVNATSFGHFGTGGSLGFADPTAGVAGGYVMNHVIPRWQSSRNRALLDALYADLAEANERYRVKSARRRS